MDQRLGITSLYRRSSRGVSRINVRARGFSLLDLLVSIAVTAVLIAILSPSLMSAHEAARRVRCAAHIQQVGYAIHMYTDDMNGRLPPAEFRPETTQTVRSSNQRPPATPAWSNDTIVVSYQSLTPGSKPVDGGQTMNWDGLGVLFHLEYVSNQAAFYCPSHHGSHSYATYSENWSSRAGKISSNYQYRVPPQSPYLSELDTWTTIMADGMATKSDYNHKIGNNYLRIDASVSWFSDEEGSLLASLPEVLGVVPHENGAGDNWRYLEQPHSH